MDLKFYIPLKEKTISPHHRDRAEISIPAKLLENIMTNRQKKINNKSFDKARKKSNINKSNMKMPERYFCIAFVAYKTKRIP